MKSGQAQPESTDQEAWKEAGWQPEEKSVPFP